MKLTYRGIQYDYNPPMLEVTESDIVGQYRGHAVRFGYARHIPIPQPAERMTYRGVAYQTNRYGQVEQLIGQQQVASVATTPKLSGLHSKLSGTSPAAQARKVLLQESSKLHKESMTRSLRHRIEVAKTQGNQTLLQQLESELQEIS